MNPTTIAAAVGTAVVVAVILGIISWRLLSTLRALEKQRAGVAYVRGIAMRFTFWEGTDPVRLQHAVQNACSVLCDIWAPWVIVELLDGVHINVLNVEAWTDGTQQRVAGVASAGTLTVSVDKSLKSLAHELAHIVEAGRGRVPPRIEHDGWTERGIYGALARYDEWLQNN